MRFSSVSFMAFPFTYSQHSLHTCTHGIFLFLTRIRCCLFFFHCRKTCQACKCPRDTHAIYYEQVSSVKERLDGEKPPGDSAKQFGYAWVPPGINPDDADSESKVSLLHFQTMHTFLLYTKFPN